MIEIHNEKSRKSDHLLSCDHHLPFITFSCALGAAGFEIDKQMSTVGYSLVSRTRKFGFNSYLSKQNATTITSTNTSFGHI